jgi:hypothetical protein
MILTIETNKRNFIKAIVELCKTSGILSYKVEEKPVAIPNVPATSEKSEQVITNDQFYNTLGAFANDDTWDNLVSNRHFIQKDIKF